MDQQANPFLPVMQPASIDFLTHINPTLTPVSSGHIPIDADVTPMDNSGSHKEGVSRTYKGHDGFAPMIVYLGEQGCDYQIRQVIRVIETTIDPHGQSLLIPDIRLEGWWASLPLDEQAIIQLYADHGTSEQFHSEFKTDLDIGTPPLR